MKLAVRVTAGHAPPDNYHGCSTRETSQAQKMTVVQRRDKSNPRLKMCKKQGMGGEDVVVIDLFPPAVGQFKPEGLCTKSKWEFSTTPAPSYKPRRRHGKGPAMMPKKEKFSSRRIVHEARKLDQVKG